MAAVLTAGISIGFSALAAAFTAGGGGFAAIGAGTLALSGAVGGAVSGGLGAALNGASGLGILQSAGFGAVLGGIGGFGAASGWVVGGLLAGGVTNAAINDSWADFAGGLVGGIAGTAVGIGGVKQYQAWKAGNSNQYSSGVSTTGGTTNSKADGHANKALVVDKGKAASGDPIIDDPSVRAQMLKALNDSNEKQLEWGEIRKRGKGDSALF